MLASNALKYTGMHIIHGPRVCTAFMDARSYNYIHVPVQYSAYKGAMYYVQYFASLFAEYTRGSFLYVRNVTRGKLLHGPKGSSVGASRY